MQEHLRQSDSEKAPLVTFPFWSQKLTKLVAELLTPTIVGLAYSIPKTLTQLISHTRYLKQIPHTDASYVQSIQRKCPPPSITAQIPQNYPTMTRASSSLYRNCVTLLSTSERSNHLDSDSNFSRTQLASCIIFPMVIWMKKKINKQRKDSKINSGNLVEFSSLLILLIA